MKYLLSVSLFLWIALSAIASPVDFNNLSDGMWNPTGSYILGLEDHHWKTAQYSTGFIFTPVGVDKPHIPEGYTSSFKNVAKEGQDNNAWLRSPALSMEKGVCYIVRFCYCYSENSSMGMRAFLSRYDPTENIESADALSCLAPLASDNFGNPVNWVEIEEKFTAPDDGIYFLSINSHASYTDNPAGTLYISAFSINKSDLESFIPAAPTDLSATVTETPEVNLQWKLPVTSISGKLFPDYLHVESVKIHRDHTEIASIEGVVTTFDDKTSLGLEPGEHTYSVQVCVGNTWSPMSEEIMVICPAITVSIDSFQSENTSTLYDIFDMYGRHIGFTDDTTLSSYKKGIYFLRPRLKKETLSPIKRIK